MSKCCTMPTMGFCACEERAQGGELDTQNAAQNAADLLDAQLKIGDLKEAILAMKHRDLPDGPCWCFLWPDENPEKVLAAEDHCEPCKRNRELINQL